MRFALFAVLFSGLVCAAAEAQVGALQTDCRLGGVLPDGSYQFVSTCAGRALSPNGQLAIVQNAYEDEQPPVELQDAGGRTVAKLTKLSDDMPFSVSWSPDSRWFYVNHHVGSFMEMLELYEVADGSAVERPDLVTSAVSAAVMRYPCLARESVLPFGVRWTADSQRIVLLTMSRADACVSDNGKSLGSWHPLWMIGDAQSGVVEPDAVRVQFGSGPFAVPTDGPYSVQ